MSCCIVFGFGIISSHFAIMFFLTHAFLQHHHVQAAPAFCDVTSAPVTTPVTTTDAPVAGEVHTTDAPVAASVAGSTDAPVAGSVDVPVHHHGKAGKVAKSAKAKGSKDGGSMRLLMDAYANDELMDAFANL
jgi:hypothetical protein